MADPRDDDAPLFEYARPGFAFRLYRNRIEVRERGFGPFARSPEVFPLRQVEAVAVTGGAVRRLELTVAGKKRTYNLAQHAGAARDAIAAALP